MLSFFVRNSSMRFWSLFFFSTSCSCVSFNFAICPSSSSICVIFDFFFSRAFRARSSRSCWTASRTCRLCFSTFSSSLRFESPVASSGSWIGDPLLDVLELVAHLFVRVVE